MIEIIGIKKEFSIDQDSFSKDTSVTLISKRNEIYFIQRSVYIIGVICYFFQNHLFALSIFLLCAETHKRQEQN